MTKTTIQYNTRTIANSFLLLSFLTYVISSCLKYKYPFLEYFVAFSEAAMIGGIADWFAVTALFKHPLGLKIPHTAIIPNSKNKIGQNISNFIRENFLSKQYVQENLSKINIADKLSLIVKNNKTEISEKIITGIFYLSKTFKYENMQHYITSLAINKANDIDMKNIAFKFINDFKNKQQHQELSNYLLKKAEKWLSDKDNEHFINEEIKKLIRQNEQGKNTFSGLVKGWVIGEPKLHKYLYDFIENIENDEDQKFKKQIDYYFDLLILKMQNSPTFNKRLDEVKNDLIKHINIESVISKLMIEINRWIEEDLISNDSKIKEIINDALDDIGEQLDNNQKLKEWIQEQAHSKLPNFIINNAKKIDDYFIEYVEKLDAKEISTLIEEKVGNDLQFIRINGTLVGGLIGLTIHIFTNIAITLTSVINH